MAPGACGSPAIALECRLGLGPNFAPHCEGWMDGSLDGYHYCMEPYACGWDTHKPLDSDAGCSSVSSKGKCTPRLGAFPDEDKLLAFSG